MSEWIAEALFSALFLGGYELFTKHAVRDNAVVPVLFGSTLTGAVVWIGLIILDALAPSVLPATLKTDPLTLVQHLQLALKSVIVAASWVFTYLAVKHLPISLGSPIRATSPVFVLLGAIVLLGERPTVWEVVGISTTIAAFIGLSIAGRTEGVAFTRNRWVWFLIAGTILGAVSALYDRHLLGALRFRVPTVQAWFSIYLLVCITPVMIGWRCRGWLRNEFHLRWSIPGIAVALLIADYIYFSALAHPDAMVSLVMSLRRGSTLVAFAGGLWFFGERSNPTKTLAVFGILVGILMTILGQG